MASFRDAADNDDALAMLGAASFGFDGGGPADVGQLAFDLAAAGTTPNSTTGDGQQPYGTQEEQQAALDYLDQLGLEDLLDDEGLDLYGSPLRSDAPDLPSTVVGADPTPHHVGSLDAASHAPGSLTAPAGLSAESTASASTSLRPKTSPGAAKSLKSKSAAPPAASFTINPNALSMNPSSMRLPAPSSHAAARAPSSDESDSPSSSQSSPARSPPRQVNAVAGPGPSSSRFHAPQGVVALPVGACAPQKRARSPNKASRSQGSSPTKSPAPPPAKRKKLQPALADDDGTTPRAAPTGKKRARADTPVSDFAPSRKKSKGKERAPERLDKDPMTVEQQIDKATRINASKARLRDLAAKYDDDRRLLFHLQQFKLMAGYDPVAARADDSKVFKEWTEKHGHDLSLRIPEEMLDNRPPKLGDSVRWRTSSSRRVMAQQDALQALFEPVPVPSLASAPSPAVAAPSPSEPAPLGPRPLKKARPPKKGSKAPAVEPSPVESNAGPSPAPRRPSAPLHRFERPLPQPKSGMSAPDAKPWHSTQPPPPGPPPSKKAKVKKAKKAPPAAASGPDVVVRPEGVVPLGAVWGGDTVWNPAAPRVAFCVLDDADLIESEDEETKQEKEYIREQLVLRRKREEEEARAREEAKPKRAPPPKKAVSKLSQLVKKKQGDLQAQQEKGKNLEKAKEKEAAKLVTDGQTKKTLAAAASTSSRLPPPQHVSRLPPPQPSHRPRFQPITKHTAYSDSDASSDDAGPSRPPAKARPKPRPRLPKAPQNGSASPRKAEPANFISIDLSSDDNRGGGMDYDPDPTPPSTAARSQPAPLVGAPSLVKLDLPAARPTVSSKSPAAAAAPAAPVRFRLSLGGKPIATLSSTPSTSNNSSRVWEVDSPPMSPPLSPIITAANLPPHSPVAYPLYTDEGQLRFGDEANIPSLSSYLEGLPSAVPHFGDPDIVCLDDDDDDAGVAAVRWEASVKERVAAARASGRLDGGGLELQGEHEDKEELFEELEIAYLPRSGGFQTQHDQLLRDVRLFQRSLVTLSKTQRRLATRIAEMVEDYWAKKEGRDAKSLKEQEKARKAGARKLSKEVRARWNLAVELIHTKHRAAEEAEERRRNTEQLSELLERSQALLADRRADLAGPSASPEPASDHEASGSSSEAESEDAMDRMRRDLFLSPPPATPSLEDEGEPQAAAPSSPAAPPQPSPVKKTLPPPPKLPTATTSSEPIILGDSSDDDDDEVEYIPPASYSDDDEEVQIISPPAPGADAQVARSPQPAALVRPKLETPAQARITEAATVSSTSTRKRPSSTTLGREEKPNVAVAEIRKAAVSVPPAEPASPSRSSTSSDGAPPRSESEVGEMLDEPETKSGRTPRIATPSLLRGELRPYQQDGLEWLVSLFNNGTNGILADEMGLGKTIQTIALLAHLACDKGLWGPHLIIVPTSVLLNWDMEFKKFLPGFNVIPYYGNRKEREALRRGWDAEGAFEVCITSYQIAVKDDKVFKRKQWGYMVLDEAHNIKNFKSKKWTTLLGFNAERRLLLTGTPLQNNLQELWSLLYFIMPNEAELDGTAFANHKTFNEWFSAPLEQAIEAGDVSNAGSKGVVDKLHTILRPHVLRRLKADVEKQLPAKREHVVYCRLSKRQRFLYDEFMTRAETREKLASGNFLSISNCLMQLRKVCNHPDLFETRPIRTSFVLLDPALAVDFEIKDFLVRRRLVLREQAETVDLSRFSLHPTSSLGTCNAGISFLHQPRTPPSPAALLDASEKVESMVAAPQVIPLRNTRTIAGWKAYEDARRQDEEALACRRLAPFNNYKCQSEAIIAHKPLQLLRQLGFGSELTPLDNLDPASRALAWPSGTLLQNAVPSYAARANQLAPLILQFAVIPPAVVAPDVLRLALPGLARDDPHLPLADPAFDTLHQSAVAHQIAFPDASLIQYDCGKLQVLFDMFRTLKAGGHRVLVFTQMTRVLDILEIFLNLHGHRYLRLDGSTKVEDRQMLMEKFNADDKVFCFIATTRSGGVGLNLTGADVVVQYDSDWNPAMDKQAQDRAHRIGQTREVNIYRLVSEHTVEENMLKKANQKRQLDDLVMQDGDFTTDFFSKLDWRDALNEFVEEALAAEPDAAAQAKRSSSSQAFAWDAAALDSHADELEDEEMRELVDAARDASRHNEDDFEADGDGAVSQRHRSATAQAGDGDGEEEDDDDDFGELEGVELFMARWVLEDWESFC